jgi:hypothetical protein
MCKIESRSHQWPQLKFWYASNIFSLYHIFIAIIILSVATFLEKSFWLFFQGWVWWLIPVIPAIQVA